MIEYILVPKNTVHDRKTNLLTRIIYENFINLAHNPELKHTPTDIDELLYSNKSYLYLCLNDDKIIGYVLGDLNDLPDGRRVFYVTYLFTSKQFRKHGIGSKLMNIVESLAKEKNLDGVLLTCDTEDVNVFEFYQKRGYMLDFQFRKYDRHDLLYKSV